MVLKGLAIGGAIAAVAIAVFAALALRPAAPAPGLVFESNPAGNVVVLPNGMAAPQLQLSQPGAAPALANELSLVGLVGMARDNAAASALKLAAEQSTGTNAVQEKALMGCGGY